MKYKILEKDRIKYVSLVILNEIIQFQHYFPVDLTGDDIYLGSYLDALHSRGLIRIDKGQYVPTEAGRNEIVSLYDKYYEFLKFFDIFCAVDLEKGEFAFASINEGTDEQWFEFLSQPRFSDVRVAVADFKGIDPIEMVFMSFLNENRFDCEAYRWQYNLTGQEVWTEIEEICNTAISLEYLREEGVIENVVQSGSELALQLIKEAEEADDEIIEEVTTEVTEEYVEVVSMPNYGYSYWEPYYDPFYISPIWLAAAIVIW